VECWFFAVYFVGAMIEPADELSPSVDRRAVKPKLVAEKCNVVFPGTALATALSETVNSAQYSELVEIRNFLSHRGAPGRTFHNGDSRHGEAHWNFPTEKLDIARLLVPEALLARRALVGSAVTAMVRATQELVQVRVA
jgi:hypothetical protein